MLRCMGFHSASPACPSARRFLKQCHVPTPRIGKLPIAGCDFTHCGEAHRSSSSSSGCRRLLCDRRSLALTRRCTTRPALPCGLGLCSLDCRRCMACPDIATCSTGAISCRELGAHGGVAFELLCLLPHTCGPASTRLCVDKHASSLCRKAFQLRLTSRLGGCVHLHSCSG